MKRLLVALLTAVLVLLPGYGAFGISDQGRPALTRLWTDDSKFVCTASYVMPRINEYAVWVLTAAHCVPGGSMQTIARNADTSMRAVVNWRAQLMEHGTYARAVVDIAL